MGRRGSGARGRGVGAGRDVAARRTDAFALGAIFDLGFALDLSGAFQRTAGFDLATTRFALAWALGVGFALVRSFAGIALAPVFGLDLEVDLPRFAVAITMTPALIMFASQAASDDPRLNDALSLITRRRRFSIAQRPVSRAHLQDLRFRLIA